MNTETNKLLKEIITRLDVIVHAVGTKKAQSSSDAERTTLTRSRRKRNGREGLRGPQTTFMAQQRKAFLDFLKIHRETTTVSRIVLARECWAIHQKEWDAAAEKGIGYSSYKALANANLMQ